MSRLTKKKAMQVADVETTLTLGRQELDAEAVDWQAVEVRFNELNALRTAPRGGLNASRAREEQGERVADAIETLLDGCQAACRRLLIEGDAKAAIEGGLKALKLKESYYSPGSLKLIPSYFHLARTNQYMDRFKAAEEFLSLAQWIILKNSSTDTALQAELHQTYGLLYASDGRLDAALKQLALATYFLTELNGPNSILTSFGYFDLGNVFAAMGGMEAAMAYYDKVKDIWYDHLTLSFQYEPFGTEARPEGVVTVEKLGEDNVQDALRMHKGIVGLQTDRFTTVHPCTGKATLVLGLYYVWISDHSDAQETLCQSLEIHKRVYGVSHATVSVIESYMTQVGYPVPDSTEHYLDPPHDDAPAQQEQGNAAADALPAGAEADAAAVKIQAVHRGRAARKLAADESRRKQAPSPGEADPGAGPQEAQAGEEDGNAPQEAQSGERDGTAPQGAQSGEGDAQEAQVGEEDGTAPQEAQSGDVNGTAPEEAQSGEGNDTAPEEAQSGEGNGTAPQAGEGDGNKPQEAQAGEADGTGPKEETSPAPASGEAEPEAETRQVPKSGETDGTGPQEDTTPETQSGEAAADATGDNPPASKQATEDTPEPAAAAAASQDEGTAVPEQESDAAEAPPAEAAAEEEGKPAEGEARATGGAPDDPAPEG